LIYAKRASQRMTMNEAGTGSLPLLLFCMRL